MLTGRVPYAPEVQPHEGFSAPGGGAPGVVGGGAADPLGSLTGALAAGAEVDETPLPEKMMSLPPFFEEDGWESRSRASRDFIRTLLTPDSSRRPTAAAALHL